MVLANICAGSIFFGLLIMWGTEVVIRSDLISNTINNLRKIFSETEEKLCQKQETLNINSLQHGTGDVLIRKELT